MSTSKTPDIEKDVQNVDDARSKLEDILNDIFDKNEDGRTPANNLGDDKTKRVNPTSYTPTKRNFSGRYARKNKKKKDLFQNESYNKKQKPSYVLKLYDRRINLARFNEKASLYKMLRDWMKNKPSYELDDDEAELQSSNKKKQDPSNEHLVYELPRCIKSEEDQRLPSVIVTKTDNIEEVLGTEENIELLKQDNMLRWRTVRQSWKNHSFQQQQKDIPSLALLKTMIPK